LIFSSQCNVLMSSIDVLNVGQLVDLEWRIGIAVKSSSCNNLAAPYVSVLAKVADPGNHKITSHTFELSIPQFMDFAKNFRDISDLMESLC